MRREFKVTGLVAAGGQTKNGVAIFDPRADHHLDPHALRVRVQLPLRALLLRARGQQDQFQAVLPVRGEQVREDQECGAGPVVKDYLLGRLMGDCREFSPESSKWLKAAQYYVAKPEGEKEKTNTKKEEKTALPKALREV